MQERYKPENVILYLVLDGPTHPHNLQPYLRLLVDELLALWEGRPVWDAARERKVLMKAMLLFNASDNRGSRGCTLHQDAGKLGSKLLWLTVVN